MRRREFMLAGLAGAMRPELLLAVDPSRAYAESAHVNGASADGKTAFILRLARYPGQDRAWLWAFAFLPEGSTYSYVDDRLPLSGARGRTPVERRRVVYELPAVPVRLERFGGPESLTRVQASVRVRGHKSTNPPVGPGGAPLEISARFAPAHAVQAGMPGRTEVLGSVEATLHAAETNISLSGLGHWHEQSGDRPSFAPTLTYATLRGERLSFIAIMRAQGDTGFVVRGKKVDAVEKFLIEPIAPSRGFSLHLAGGEVIEGSFAPVHSYTMTIEGRSRPGSIGVAQTEYGSLSGMINDWKAA